MLRSMKALRGTCFLLALLFAAHAEAQGPRRASASRENGDFGTKFFDELRSLFGRLRDADLDRAFRRGRAIRCADLAEKSGVWKEVAFLNGDRKIGNWHFESLAEVNRELATFKFSGECGADRDPLSVAISYPVQESINRFNRGIIPQSEIVMTNNPPARARFNSADEAYVFEVSYVYLDNKPGPTPLYTLTPPLTTSKPVAGLGIEFRCKTASDADPSFLFLLCYTEMVDHKVPAPRPGSKPPLGNSAYYILSDGKEAGSTIKLVFGTAGGDAPAPQPDTAKDAEAPKAEAPKESARSTESAWQQPGPTASLMDAGDLEFRLRFDPQSWKDRIAKPQLLTGANLTDLPESSTSTRSPRSCVWLPLQARQLSALLEQASADSVVYTLRFTQNRQSPTTAIFAVESDTGQTLGSLQCTFQQGQTAADIKVENWQSIVGTHVQIQIHRR